MTGGSAPKRVFPFNMNRNALQEHSAVSGDKRDLRAKIEAALAEAA